MTVEHMKFNDLTQFEILKNELERRDVLVHTNHSDNFMKRMSFSINDIEYSVICGIGSYGGRWGLLEIMVDYFEPTGNHTAHDIIGKLFYEKEKTK